MSGDGLSDDGLSDDGLEGVAVRDFELESKKLGFHFALRCGII